MVWVWGEIGGLLLLLLFECRKLLLFDFVIKFKVFWIYGRYSVVVVGCVLLLLLLGFEVVFSFSKRKWMFSDKLV